MTTTETASLDAALCDLLDAVMSAREETTPKALRDIRSAYKSLEQAYQEVI